MYAFAHVFYSLVCMCVFVCVFVCVCVCVFVCVFVCVCVCVTRTNTDGHTHPDRAVVLAACMHMYACTRADSGDWRGVEQPARAGWEEGLSRARGPMAGAMPAGVEEGLVRASMHKAAAGLCDEMEAQGSERRRAPRAPAVQTLSGSAAPRGSRA